MTHYRLHKPAFTIIELLVVIVIIGLLTGLATTSYLNAQKNARDNTRKTGVASISTAVEAFYQTKHRFPGLIGNEGTAAALANERTTWAGCLAIDTTSAANPSVEYYSYPTLSAASGGLNEHLACNERTNSANFNHNLYSPYPSWIPELGEYINPTPIETRYQDKNGSTSTLDSSSGSFSATDDVLGSGNAQAFAYRHLVGGYMVYTKLEAVPQILQ
jgi:prepilin-type N-terminal cleavage/methylation domain-containing protein